MPDAAWAVSVHPPSLSRKMGQPPVLTSSNPLSTLQQRFACARLSQSCLPESCSGFSATFTTVAFDHSSLPAWQLLCDGKLYQLLVANWSGRPVFTGQERNFDVADKPELQGRIEIA